MSTYKICNTNNLIKGVSVEICLILISLNFGTNRTYTKNEPIYIIVKLKVYLLFTNGKSEGGIKIVEKIIVDKPIMKWWLKTLCF